MHEVGASGTAGLGARSPDHTARAASGHTSPRLVACWAYTGHEAGFYSCVIVI